jgi:hypothetical protein
MFCHQCGAPVEPGAKFCAKCGISLAEAPLEAVHPGETSPHPPELAIPQSQVRPWVRYWARMFDITSFSLIAGLILGLLAPDFIARAEPTILGIILIFVWVFIESLLLSSFGTTPGKWLFNIKVRLKAERSIVYADALGRSIKVWWRGLGAGVPLITLITALLAYKRLTQKGITSWDEEGGFFITHDTIGILRILTAIAYFVLLLALLGMGTKAPGVDETGL